MGRRTTPMAAAEQHPDQARRLAALDRYGVLDTPREDDFDDIARLAAQVCDAPIALISFVAEEEQWFKAHIGTDLDGTAIGDSVCAHAILGRDVLQIPDAAADPRTADSRLVTDGMGMRFYAGVPLTTDEGLPLGTLCVIDRRRRTLDEAQLRALRALARQVMTQLELRRALRAEAEAVTRAERQAAQLARSLEAAETLRLEIDHRVKNSLQLVSSLLQMQASRSGSEEVRHALGAARGRVLAISSIHAALNRSSEADRVRLRSYAERLVEELQASAPGGVEIALTADEIELRSSEASSLAILVNEFVTNSLKYAFPDGRAGRVRLDIRRDGDRVRALFSDDGVGHTVADGRPVQEGLGTRIMHAVGQQLGATLDFVADVRGTTLAFDFPLAGPD